MYSAWPIHDDVIKWKQFPRYWPFVRGIHRSPVNSPHKGHWRGALMASLICAWTNEWANAGDLKRNRTHYDATVMLDLRLFTGACMGNVGDFASVWKVSGVWVEPLPAWILAAWQSPGKCSLGSRMDSDSTIHREKLVWFYFHNIAQSCRFKT